MKAKTVDESTIKRLATAHTNFSSTINAQTRLKVLTEARPLLDAQLKCKDIWHALQVADYKKEGSLNDAALQILMDKQGKNLTELLLVRNVEDILDLFDSDEDGFLNEDEQIMIFSAIKERMQICSEDLCRIHEYNLYKDIMKGIRQLEDDINAYQKILRARNQTKELNAYHEIGEDRLKKFLQDWEEKFKEFEDESQTKISQIQEIHLREREELNKEIEAETEISKIKPKALVKNLQVREKLVAVNERYGEAQTIRNELKSLEISEQKRVENLVLVEHQKKRKKLLKKQEREIEFAMLKNKAAYNKLIIQKEQERVKLDKQIKLHLNDITKSQNIASALADKLAKTRDELRRTKVKSRKVQEYLSEAKSMRNRGKSNETFPMLNQSANKVLGVQSTISNSIGFKSVSPLKRTLNNITKFKIKSDNLGKEVPVNAEPDFTNSNSIAGKAAKILQQFSKNNKPLQPLSSLYDDSLHLLSII